MAITLPPDEFPAGFNLTAMLDVRNVTPRSVVTLACSEAVSKPVSLHIGEQTQVYSLQRLSPDQLFLSADTGGFPAGCSLQATITNGSEGFSEPYTLAHIIRLPEIQSFDSTPQLQADGKRVYTLTGRNLEMIEKVGWDQIEAIDIPGLPTPIQGQGQRQALQVNLPEPVPAHAALYVWLRGEKTASATTLAVPPKAVASNAAPLNASPEKAPPP